MTSLKPRNRATHRTLSSKAPPNAMSNKTKFFIQKICYKKTASIDMTKNGFMKYTMIQPLKLLLKPLKEQITKMFSPSFQNNQAESAKSPTRKRRKNSKVRECKQPVRKVVKKKKPDIITKNIPKKHKI